MSFRQRLRRLREKAEDGAVVVHQRDGTLRRFALMEVQAQMFLANTDLWKDEANDYDVLAAVRNATLESRAAFEERFGSITPTNYVIGRKEEGGWVESVSLTEDGRVEKIRYEGDSKEAELVRDRAMSGSSTSGPGKANEELVLPKPPMAGRWVNKPAEDLS